MVDQADFGTWRYSVGRGDDGAVRGLVQFDITSVEGLVAYVDANRQLVGRFTQEEGPIPVQVTFRDYVAPDAFRAWIAKVHLQVARTDVGEIEPNGKRWTATFFTMHDDPLPGLQSVGNDSNPPRTLLGVFGALGSVDASQLVTLAADPSVFLVDLTEAYVRQRLAQEGIAGAGEATVTVASPFGAMEDFGLANFSGTK